MSLESKLALKGRSIEVIDPPSGVVLPSTGARGGSPVLLVFVLDSAALRAHRDRIVASAQADALTWVAYPKAGQRGTDLNRDTLAAYLAGHGIRPVTQIAIDGTWSALRFRPGVRP